MAKGIRASDLRSIHVLLYMLVITPCQCITSAVTACKLMEEALTCENDIPKVLPYGVQEVYIKNYANRVLKAFPNNIGWSSVTKLDIDFVWPDCTCSIKNNTFLSLKKLKYIGIHGDGLKTIETNGLVGLSQVKEIDLSGCGRIDSLELTQAFQRVSWQNLDVLNFRGLSSRYGGLLAINEDFKDFLAKSSITSLDVSSTNMFLPDLTRPKHPLTLKMLNMSNTTIIFHGNGERLYFELFFSTVQVLNASYMNSRYEVVAFQTRNTAFDLCKMSYALNLTNVYVNFNSDNRINTHENVSIYVIDCEPKLRLVHARGNNIRRLNTTIHTPRNNLQELDLSDNHMEYVSPMFFKDLIHLHTLRLANNSLHEMQRKEEFGVLITTCEELEHFSLAQNDLSYIPQKMFRNNGKLNFLDLASNKLETIQFDIEMLVHLESVRLNNNRFKQLDASTLSRLTTLVNIYRSNGTYLRPDIELHGNPFVCDCRGLAYVKWLVRHPSRDIESVGYRCILDNSEVSITADTVDRVDYLCRRTSIIIATTAACCLTTAGIVLVTVLIVRKVKRKRLVDLRLQFIRDFNSRQLKNGNNVVKYVVFLSHCSDDLILVQNYIYTEISRVLKDIFQGDDEVVCLGNKCFRPGFAIVAEMMKCMSESCVAIFVVSRSFCQSNWCQMEIKEAYEQQRPIVLVFTEHVEERLMSPFLLTIYRRYTRARIIRQGDLFDLEPSWELFGDCVITLASMDAQAKQARVKIDF